MTITGVVTDEGGLLRRDPRGQKPGQQKRRRSEHGGKVGPAIQGRAIFTGMDRGSPIEQDAPYVNVRVEPTDRIITIRWKNYAPSGTYRATLNMAVDLILEYRLRYFLTDQRRRGAILHEDEVWLVTDWAPRMARAGLVRSAIVQSPDFFNRTTIERVVKTVLPSVPCPIMNFQSMEEARAWLMTGELEFV